jgi:hypothetical protein
MLKIIENNEKNQLNKSIEGFIFEILHRDQINIIVNNF